MCVCNIEQQCSSNVCELRQLYGTAARIHTDHTNAYFVPEALAWGKSRAL